MSDSPSDKTDYFLQILNTIGKPLIVPVLKQGDNAPEDIAKHMAELLAKSVQTSIDLGPLIEIDTLGDKSDSARVALAGLSSHILAGLYDHFGRMPADSDIKKISNGLQAAISFADNFTASPESTLRAASVEAGGQEVDSPQSSVQFLRSFIPVIQAVSGFSFGKPEATLISEIAQKLTAKASEIGAAHYTDTHKGDDLKAVERGILHALAEIYAAAHEAETKRLSSATDRDEEAGGSLESVWAAFDTQVQILEVLIQGIVPGGKPAGDVAPSTDAKAPADISAETPAAPASPIAGIVAGAKGGADKANTPAPTPAEESKSAAPPAGDNGNPMSFFSGPKSDDAEKTPAADAPAATPPPADTPQPAAPDAPKDDDEKPAGNPGNPMSFFSAPKKDGDDE